MEALDTDGTKTGRLPSTAIRLFQMLFEALSGWFLHLHLLGVQFCFAQLYVVAEG